MRLLEVHFLSVSRPSYSLSSQSLSSVFMLFSPPPQYCRVMLVKIPRTIATFLRYSSSLSIGCNRNELRERVRKFGFELHLPQEGLQIKTRSLALLVGWAESRQRALSKFATIYTKQGIPCLTVACPVSTLWFTSVGSKLVGNVVTLLDVDTPSDDHIDLAVHIFSGGGSAVFPGLLKEFAKPKGVLNKIQPSIFIFDSGPVKFSYESGMAAARLLYKQGGSNFFTYSASVLVGNIVNLFIGSRKQSELDTALNSQLLNVPQLYLYSTADSVCSSEWVEKVMAEQLEKGRIVESFNWEDSEHVRHLAEHPEKYEQLVVDFLKKHFL